MQISFLAQDCAMQIMQKEGTPPQSQVLVTDRRQGAVQKIMKLCLDLKLDSS